MITVHPGRWTGTADMTHHRLLLALTPLVLLLAGCSSAEPSPPETAISLPPSSPIPTVSPTAPIVESIDDAAGSEPVPAVPSLHPSTTPTLSLSLTPAPALRRLTNGGCCVEPFWSPDGQQVLYIDRPSQDTPSGLWSVDALGSAPQFITDRLGIYSADMQLRAFPQNGATYIEDLSTGEQESLPNGGRAVSFSPDKAWLAWTAGQSGPPFNIARRDIWISRVDGNQDRMVFSGIRAGFEGWFPDGRLLVSGLVEGPDSEQALWVLSPDQTQDGQPELVELGRGGRLRDARISPNGEWVAYLVTFSTDPAQDGLWLADARSGERHRLDIFGGYQWRDDQRLLILPLELSQPVHRLLQVEAKSGQLQAVTEPSITPFKIANGDWSVSPDGEMITFVSADDGNIWVLELPD